MNSQLKHSESGRTMLEMLGVLGIMGIIMYGAIAGINYGMSTYKINQTYNEIQEAVQGVQDLYSWSREYTGLSSELACKNDIFTNCNAANEPNSPFGGAIDVGPFPANVAFFTITYRGVDQASCNRLREMEWGTVVMDSSCASDPSDIIFCPKAAPCHETCDDNGHTGFEC